jgi:hypothetical protein
MYYQLNYTEELVKNESVIQEATLAGARQHALYYLLTDSQQKASWLRNNSCKPHFCKFQNGL